MTTWGCSEEEYISNEEQTNDHSNARTKLCPRKSELNDEIGENHRKRLQSFDSNNQNTSGSVKKKRVTFSMGLAEKTPTNCDEQSTSSEEEIVTLRNKINTSVDQLLDKYDERMAEILKGKEAEWAAERKGLEKKVLDLSESNHNLEKKLLDTESQLKKSCEFVKSMVTLSGKMNTDGMNISSTIDNFLSTT